MKHVLCEMTSPTSYRITVNGEVKEYKCELILLPGKPGKKQEAINPTHNEAWARMNREAQ